MGDETNRKEASAANTAADGTYIIGKGKPPESGKFRVGDGRKRGRRTKGTRNLETDFTEELQDSVTVTVNGKARRITKQRSIVMRLLDNAARGQPNAVKLALEYGGKYGGTSRSSSEENVSRTETLPHLNDLSADELETFGRLLYKACGETLPELPPNPFAHMRDPDNPTNYYSERDFDGLHYERSRVDAFDHRLTKIENGAYRSATLARVPGCNRRQF